MVNDAGTSYLFPMMKMGTLGTSSVGFPSPLDGESSLFFLPNDLPVATLFRAVGQKVQGLLDYTPGRSVDEEPPVATFKEDELQGESGTT